MDKLIICVTLLSLNCKRRNENTAKGESLEFMLLSKGYIKIDKSERMDREKY